MAISSIESKSAQDWINIVLALGLVLSPWIVGFAGVAVPAWNAWVIGIALGAMTIAALSAFAEWEEWVNVVLGLWLVASPWMLGFAAVTSAMWTHVVMGVLVALVSAWAVWGHRHAPHAHA